MRTGSSDKWLGVHDAEMIRCPNQPGNLRLSAAACAKRHACAQQARYLTVAGDSPQIVAFKYNLAPCRGCAIGKALAGKGAVA